MRIAMIGGTGLVGGFLAQRLLAGGHEVDALLRRPSGRLHSGWREHVAPPAEWTGIVAPLQLDAAISALGTTMREAGSRSAFRAVDHDIVLAFARAARAAGARRMLAVSSVGAEPGSRSFYLRVKGEVEEELVKLGFERLDLFRPGLLRGQREGDPRPGERFGILISPVANLFLQGPLDRYAAIDATIVADAMAAALEEDAGGTFCHHNREIKAWAQR
jgi:uncharacterized protein YbjT (DUF2867 family)